VKAQLCEAAQSLGAAGCGSLRRYLLRNVITLGSVTAPPSTRRTPYFCCGLTSWPLAPRIDSEWAPTCQQALTALHRHLVDGALSRCDVCVDCGFRPGRGLETWVSGGVGQELMVQTASKVLSQLASPCFSILWLLLQSIFGKEHWL